MSGMFEDITPEERAVEIGMWTDMTMWNGKHGYYRAAGKRDGENNWQRITVPDVDSEFQSDYDAGYSDGQYWYSKLNAVTTM